MKSIFEMSRKAIFAVLACAALFLSGVAYAQGPVKGKVVEPDGTPVIGASVLVPGTTRGTVTDVQGEFQINVTAGTNLEVSCIGYATKTVTAADGMSVILEQDSTNLDEVVVVDYGVQKKVNLTGAVSSVRGEDLAFKNVMSTAQSLQGVAAGLTVTTATGEPDDATMRVRGIGTLNNNDPLILIDGVGIRKDFPERENHEPLPGFHSEGPLEPVVEEDVGITCGGPGRGGCDRRTIKMTGQNINNAKVERLSSHACESSFMRTLFTGL